MNPFVETHPKLLNLTLCPIHVNFYLPNKEVRFFTFQFPLKYIGIALVLLDIPGLFSQNSGGTIAHFGGYILGCFYARQFQKGIDMGEFIDKVTAYFSKSKSKCARL